MDEKRRRRISGEVGTAIERARKKAGLTQHKLAEALGIGLEAVSRIERGVVHPPVWRLVQIAEILGCGVGELTGAASDAPVDQLKGLAAVLEGLSADDRAFVIGQATQTATQLRRHSATGRRRP